MPAPSESVESYIVRIYRRSATSSAPLTGVVEDPVRATQRAFHSLSELEAILCRPNNGARPEGRRHGKRQT